MLPLLIHKLLHLFSKDTSPEALEKLDTTIKKDLIGLSTDGVLKAGAVIMGIFVFLFSLLLILIFLTKWLG